MSVIHLVEKQGAETRVAGIKVDQQGAMLHVRKLDGEVCRDGGFALAERGGGDIEAVVLFLGAQAVAQDIRRRREVLHHDRGPHILLLCHDGTFALIEFIVVRDDADSLKAKDGLHVAHVVERGMHQQLDDGKADARHEAQQREQDNAVVAAAHDADLLGNGLVDDLE